MFGFFYGSGALQESLIMQNEEQSIPLRKNGITAEAIGQDPCYAAKVKHILAPTDLTPEAHKGIDYAVGIAQRTGAVVTLLHVHDEDTTYRYVLGGDDFGDEDVYREKAEMALRQLCVDYREKYSAITTCYRVGVPWDEVASAAREFDSDLIVVSTHNHRWIGHLLNGSDAERMFRRAPCPVLVVPLHE
jgi:nucleotide-binding universal stress UspA family protein